MKKILSACLLFLCFSIPVYAQIPVQTLVRISKAEDELRYDKTVEDLMKSADARIRARAAFAAGRIGSDGAIPALVILLKNDRSADVRAASMFALGEIESIEAANVILKSLQNKEEDKKVRARALEAAGKIAAAANAKNEKNHELGTTILDALNAEAQKTAPDMQTVLLGLTAILRARPEGGEIIAAKFTESTEGEIRAVAANTLSRLRAKNANRELRKMLSSDRDPIARANAARALGAAEDKDAFALLLKAAVSDADSRVRVSATRSLGSLKEAKAADKLLERGENLLSDYKKSKLSFPAEKNELIELAVTLGKLLTNTKNNRAVNFLETYCKLHIPCSLEIEIAQAQISPAHYLEKFTPPLKPKTAPPARGMFLYAKGDKALPISGVAQALGELAKNSDVEIKTKAGKILHFIIDNFYINEIETPIVLRAYAEFKPTDLEKYLRIVLRDDFADYKNVILRATAAELLSEQTTNKENVELLKNTFAKSLKTDKFYNDAQLAILSALVKLDKNEASDSLKLALDAPDYLVRRHAADLIKQNDLSKEFPNAEAKTGTVKLYNPKTGTRLGQILNRNADYIRAVSRKSAKAILTTEKGTFTIELLPEDAPLTVDNFIKLAKSGYFNGLTVHRVVPNFVMQDGDPRGDGNGGPGWSIRDEINTVPYERGTVGMALSGKNTGGSQWFVTHSPQPHLDGGYTVFGRVNENDMKIVDNLVRGDKILSVKIVENNVVTPTINNKRRAKAKR